MLVRGTRRLCLRAASGLPRRLLRLLSQSASQPTGNPGAEGQLTDDDAAAEEALFVKLPPSEMWTCKNCGFNNRLVSLRGCERCGAWRKVEPGFWLCPNCDTWSPPKRNTCARCFLRKPPDEQLQLYGQPRVIRIRGVNDPNAAGNGNPYAPRWKTQQGFSEVKEIADSSLRARYFALGNKVVSLKLKLEVAEERLQEATKEKEKAEEAKRRAEEALKAAEEANARLRDELSRQQQQLRMLEERLQQVEARLREVTGGKEPLERTVPTDQQQGQQTQQSSASVAGATERTAEILLFQSDQLTVAQMTAWLQRLGAPLPQGTITRAEYRALLLQHDPVLRAVVRTGTGGTGAL